MKKQLLLISLFIINLQSSIAQFVDIPDNAFRALLQQRYSSSFNNQNQLDTTSLIIVNLTSLNISNQSVKNIEGIQYFDNLKDLDCSYNNITDLPKLPPYLINLNCQSNNLLNLSNIPALPSTLKKILFTNNPNLQALPSLPSALEYLDCYSCQLNALPDLPTSLTYLNSSGSYWIKSLPKLPNSLRTLLCYGSSIASLPKLPDSLRILNCGTNLLSSLPSLPNSLERLECFANNNLHCLPLLPQGLKLLILSPSAVSCILNKPDSLIIMGLEYGINQYTYPKLKICDESSSYHCQSITDIKDVELDKAPILYPNPAKSKITIHLVDTDEISIYNSNGHIVMQQQVSGKQEIDIQGLVVGLYFYKIGTRHGRFEIQ